MNTTRLLLAMLLGLSVSPALYAQEKPGTNAAADAIPAFRVQVVLAEYDGANKIASLPYTIPVAPVSGGDGRAYLRTGIRVPVASVSKSGESGTQYVDVGANMDVHVKRADAERYLLELTVERSWLYVRQRDKDGNVQGRAWAPGDPAPESAPLIHTFRTNVQFVLRDGRGAETTLATDPVTGHLFKVEAQLTVLK